MSLTERERDRLVESLPSTRVFPHEAVLLLGPTVEAMLAEAWDAGFQARQSHFHAPDGRNPYREAAR